MTAGDDHRHMAHAVRLAANGLYTTDPNPRVGCVLVREGRVVGEGWHARAGEPHAERVALAAAGTDAQGATAYVSLEPCTHHGRTAPCAEALAGARVARVVCAGLDPNPLVAGRGVERLRAAGIDVATGVLESAAAELNPGYLSRRRRGRPWVRSKLAVSLDGRTALANGESQWITGAEARRDVHRWRARSSAVLTGTGSVLRDDPRLNARLEPPEAVLQPLRVIVDSELRTPPGGRLFTAGEPAGDVLVFTTRAASETAAAALRAAGARVERVGGRRHCDLAEVLARLAALEINELWVEAGPVLNGALLAAGLIDELVLYVAPQLLGDSARGMFAFGPLTGLDQRVGVEYRSLRRVGRDLRVIARPTTVADSASGAFAAPERT